MKKIFFSLLILVSVFFLVSKDSGAETSFNNGVFIKGSGPMVYFLEDGMKRWIETADVFNAYGFNWKDIRYASQEELERYPTGASIKSGSTYPDGVLLRQAGDPKVYRVEKGSKRWVEDIETFNDLGLRWDDIFVLPEAKMKKVRAGKSIVQHTPLYRPATVLLETPEDNTLEDTSVNFKFSAITGTFISDTVVFDTFLDGYDKRWVTTTKGERSINLPKEAGDYIFYVRARYKNGEADPTPEMFKFKVDLSPIFGTVKFSSVNVTSTDPEKEVITLTNGTNIIYYISGWSIESKENGNRYYIPTARLVPNYLGYDYGIDVRMAPKDKVVIVSSRGPLGYGFKLNNCVGYLDDYFDFNPSLPRYCPKLETSDIDHLSDYCQKVIRSSTSSCTQPDYNDVLLNNECRDFMRDKLNYASCVDANVKYYDFYKGEWRLYLGRTNEAWKETHDTLILRDQNGLVVDTYKY